jgi:hypothetical protein
MGWDNLTLPAVRQGYQSGIMFEELSLECLVSRIKQSFGGFYGVRFQSI